MKRGIFTQKSTALYDIDGRESMKIHCYWLFHTIITNIKNNLLRVPISIALHSMYHSNYLLRRSIYPKITINQTCSSKFLNINKDL